MLGNCELNGDSSVVIITATDLVSHRESSELSGSCFSVVLRDTDRQALLTKRVVVHSPCSRNLQMSSLLYYCVWTARYLLGAWKLLECYLLCA